MPQLKYWQAINQAMAEELERDPATCLLGEDVGAAGGAFGASAKLQERFGEWRVRDTPISEATIVGAALGASMSGLRPIVEVMFFDFMAVAMDQVVNQAAKISFMSAGKYHAPMVVRTMAGTGRGTGPQHGQNLEGWLAHVPGLKVVWASEPADAKGLLKSAIRDDDPVVVIESLALWSRRGEVPEDPDHLVPIGRAAIRRAGRDVTVVSWGAAVHRALAAAAELEPEVDVEVVDLRSLSPLDREGLFASVEKTGRLVVVHEAVGSFGPGAEIASLAADECFDALRAPVRRVTPPFAPVPFPPQLEKAYFPQVTDIVAAVRDVTRRAA
ncbi:MAG: alpha-ketoacid dehydrogenase subunit beta [Streptosporangiales bacterium]|nr:alpha-ketoacid dehydrogenase subunit beta [Streptosporangiales bacterium]